MEKTIKEIKSLNQYYRDSFSRSFGLPSSLSQPQLELARWVMDGRNTNFAGLVERLQNIPTTSTKHDLALRLMLFSIMQANLAALPNNRFIGYMLPQGFAENLKNGLKRVLSLHNHEAYFVLTVQLLYRINMIDDVIELSKTYPDVFNRHAILQALLGFIYTMLGNYENALQYLNPLAKHQVNQNLPFVNLSFMTCQYFLGQEIEWPLTFESLHSDTSNLSLLIQKLPAIEIIQPIPDSLSYPIIFVACDDSYFYQHALYLAYSIHDSNPGKVALHIHLFSPNKSVLAEIAALRARLPNLIIGVSVETADVTICLPTVYYSTIRFVRAYELLVHYQKDICIMDADALVINDWDTFTAHLDPMTEIALACPEATPFWEQIMAGFLYCKATPKAKNYLARVAQFILQNILQKKAIWFTDQIALSVCDDYFMKSDPSVKRIQGELLMDINHNPQAFSWAITNVENDLPCYDALRHKLGKKYYQLPLASVDYILEHVGRTFGKIFFLQIGAMDGVSFDPIYPYVRMYGWSGILVEPLPDMMQKVKDNYAHQTGLIFENIAITEQEEIRPLYRIPIDVAKVAGLPKWVLGMSTFVAGKLDEFKPHVVEQLVSCMPLSNLLAKHQPESINVLQIDTEGYDYKVLRQFDFKRYKPYIVNFEFVNLSPEEKMDAMELLFINDYVFYQNDMDIFAVRRDILFMNQFP